MADLEGRIEKGDGGHREFLELLPWYLNKTLEPEERARVEDHLRKCSTCQRELGELTGLRQAVTIEEPQLSGALVQGAMRRIRARRDPETRESISGWWRGFLRPRLALSLSALAVVFLGLGVFVGFQFGVNRAAIGGAPAPGFQSAHTTDQYFAFPRAILIRGTLTMQVGNRPLEEEDFTLEKQEDGRLLLTSNIQANELAAVQNLQLTSDSRPLSYSLQGPLVYRGIRAEAGFTDDQANLSVCCATTAAGQEISRRIVQLDDFPVLYDFSVMSHFALMQRVLAEQLARGISPNELKFSAITPQALRVEPLWVEDIQPATLTSQGRLLSVTRYSLAIGQQKENPLRVNLYALDNEELLAIYIPVQPRLASSSAIFAYRSDLYPQGLEIPQTP
ncbi:MAG: hypothetical protein A2Z21_05970 [Candidatus Fraserbacteria bacterium RBG_16_55_9]|uniref:Putative zinc-finger domain-containing protein n=1 Tax=Fraserbacteria sp. (strain RBG_16_55_9) TaxID=1817864 RepID=A0A1F5V1W1_FRAXR|nr:MAG: hypothetical protein A2Z21_05970 [Candidatus Fraserbacteria bacterium RBG_16_55_9]